MTDLGIRRVERFLSKIALLTQRERRARGEVGSTVEPDDQDGTAMQRDGAGRIQDLARAALRASIADRRAGRDHPELLADRLRGACDAAREQGLHAEELLIIVKQCWLHLSDTRVLERHAADEALESIVATCIREFYRPGLEH